VKRKYFGKNKVNHHTTFKNSDRFSITIMNKFEGNHCLIRIIDEFREIKMISGVLC